MTFILRLRGGLAGSGKVEIVALKEASARNEGEGKD